MADLGIEAPEGSFPKIMTIRENKRREHNEFQESNRYSLYKARRSHLSGVEKEFKSVTREELQQLIAEVKKSSKDESLLRRLKKALSESELNRETFIRADGAIHGLVGVLIGNEVAAQIEAAGSLVNLLATSNHKVVKPVVRQAAPYFIQYLHGGYPALKDLCCLALGNIAADCAACCNILKSQNFFHAIKSVLDSSLEDAKGSALFALGCYLSSKPEDSLEMLETHLITPSGLCANLANKDSDVIVETSKILYYLSTRPECDRYLLDPETVERVIQKLAITVSNSANTGSEVFLLYVECQIVTYLLRTVGAMFAMSDSLLLPMPSVSFEDWNQALRLLLSTNHEHLTKESLWLIGNMTCFLNSESVWFNDVSLLRCIANKLLGPQQQLEPAIECFCNALTLGSEALAALCRSVISEETVLRLASSGDPNIISKTITLAHLLLEKNSSDLVSEAFRKLVINLKDSESKDVSDIASAFLTIHL